MLRLHRKLRWKVVVRPVRATARPIRVRLGKRDRLKCDWPPATAKVELIGPSRRLAVVRAGDRLEVYRSGVLMSNLPIRTIRYEALLQKVTIFAEERGF